VELNPVRSVESSRRHKTGLRGMHCVRTGSPRLARVLAWVVLAVAPAAHLGSGSAVFADEGWQTLAAMPVPECGLAAATDLLGRVYAIGGGCFGDNSNLVQRYTPWTNRWTIMAPLPTPRRFLVAARGGDGRIYAIGGVDTQYSGRVDIYSPWANRWVSGPTMPTPRSNSAVAVVNGRIYVIGGCCDEPSNLPFTTVEVFDPFVQTWSTAAPLPEPLAFLGAATGRDGLIYAVGGRKDLTNSNCCAVADVFAYNHRTNTWRAVASMSTPRESHSVAAGRDGLIYAIGGGVTSPTGFVWLSSTEAYRPSTDTWSPAPPISFARSTMGATTRRDGRIYALGGVTISGDSAIRLDTVQALRT
jgi:N-acetylneuraminic acid mutarotase